MTVCCYTGLGIKSLEAACGENKVFSRKFYLGWTVLWGWDSGVIHKGFDEWGTVMGLCKMFISPHGSHRALQHLQSHFYWAHVWRVAREWVGWEWRSLGESLLASVSSYSNILLQFTTVSPVPWVVTACYVNKNCFEILPEHVSLCLLMATCGTSICRWSCACVWMQMVRGVSGRMGVCTKTTGLTSMAPLQFILQPELPGLHLWHNDCLHSNQLWWYK